MRLVIVDDERLERMGLMKMIQTEMPEVTIVGEAKNGRMAIELAEKLKPDVMMMDIKMPGIDGVEAVKTIRKQHRDIQFIMISAFNTFEYAKEVMREGVKEYILKPSRKEEVIAALRRVQEDLLDQQLQKKVQENYVRALSLMESGWLSSVLLEQVEDMYLEEWSALLGLGEGLGLVTLFSLKGEKATTKDHLLLFYDSLQQKKKDGPYEVVVGPVIDDKVPVLLLFKQPTNPNKIKAEISQFVRNTIFAFREKGLGAKILAGIGRPYGNLEEFKKSYHEANMALERIQDDQTPYLFFSEQIVQTLDAVVMLDLENKLLGCLKAWEHGKVLQAFDQYFAEWSQRVDDVGQVRVELEKLFVVISREIYKMGYLFQIATTLTSVEEGEQLYQEARGHLKSCLQSLISWRQPNVKGMIQKAKEIIDERFREGISLEDVAESVGVTPFYFSKMFKEKMGVTFIDYVTDLRIAFAKEEMQATGKSFKEICFEAGYNDPNYFSRVFKKKTGVTPKEYRQALAR